MAGANDSKLQKKLPKRANRSHRKHDKRMGHKSRAQVRKARRRAAQAAREAFNNELRAKGIRIYGPEGRALRAAKFSRHASV